MAGADHFGEKLTLVLKALSVSRGRLAAEVGVDKSVVGRWASGAVVPSALNLERLTHFIAGRAPGFTLLDWDRDLAGLAGHLGVEPPSVAEAGSAAVSNFLPEAMLAEGRANIAARGEDFAGIWRTTRPQAGMKDQLIHDHILQWVAPDGLLRHIYCVAGQIRYEGWAIPIHDQLYTITSDAASGTFIFTILHGVPRRRAMVMEGIALNCMRGRDSLVTATPCLFERVAEVTGDMAADEACFARAIAGPVIAPEGSISAEVRARMFPDIGPAAAANGGHRMLAVALSNSLASVAPLGSSFWTQRPGG